jgi:hypothetical protein
MQELNIPFDPEVDGASGIILVGTFPAHLVNWVEGGAFNDSLPFNPTYRIAPEAAEVIGEDPNTKEQVKAIGMVGQEIKGAAVWLCPKPKPGEGWKNKGYVEFSAAAGIDFPSTTDKDTGKITIHVGGLELIDVLGKAFNVVVGYQIHKEDKEKPVSEQRKYPRVLKVFPWEDGEELDLDDLLQGDGETEKNPFAGIDN